MNSNKKYLIPASCLESPYPPVVTKSCRFAEKILNRISTFVINLCHEDVKLKKKKHTLAYLVPTQYKPLSPDDEGTNNENAVYNISTASEAEVEILPTIPINSKLIFPENYTPMTYTCTHMK